MLYLADCARHGASLSTVRGWAASINRIHREAGHRPPGDDPAMSTFMRGVGRVAQPKVVTQVAALRIADVRAVCRHLDELESDPSALRDCAILALSAEGLSDGAISRLDWVDVTLAARSTILRLRGFGRSPERMITCRRGSPGRVTAHSAVSAWRAASPDHGPVFVSSVRPELEGHRLTPKSVFAARRSRLSSMGDRAAWPADRSVLDLLTAPPSELLRDRALILVGFAGAFRRVDLTRLRWRDISYAPEGLVIRLATSKTDLDGRGRDVGIPSGSSSLTCPVRSLTRWQARMQALLGAEFTPDVPVFVRVGRSGRIGTTPLTPEALTRVVQRRTAGAGLGGHWGGRSLRAGFISTAADLDIPLELIARQSRHATLDSLILYIRNDDPFRRNPAARVGM